MAIEAISELTNLQKKHPYLFNDHRFRRRSKNYANNSAGDIRSQRYAVCLFFIFSYFVIVI